MTQTCNRLPGRLWHGEGHLSLAWVLASEWENVLLALRQVNAEYAAFPVEHYGWLVLTTARLRGHNVPDTLLKREHWLEEFLQKHASELMLCSPGWLAAVTGGDRRSDGRRAITRRQTGRYGPEATVSRRAEPAG
jgi:hypothetical protein